MKTAIAIFAAALLPLVAPAEDTIKSKVVDAENHSMTETIADSHGKILKKTQFFFDDDNWTKMAIHFDMKDQIRYKEVFKRNGKLVLESWLYSKDDKVLGHRAFQYDGSGNVTHIDDYNANNQLLTPAPRAVPVSPGRPDKKKR